MKTQALLLSLVLVLFISLLNCSDSNTGSSDNGGGLLGDPGAPVASGCPDAENPCCADPATDVSLNACFASVNQQTLEPGFAPAQAGVLVHGWDGTEAEGTPWIPGQQQGPTKRWSSSYINRLNVSSGNPNPEGQNAPPTISIYSIFSGGIVLAAANTKISCAFAQDAGTDSRPSDQPEYPDGCGPKVSGEGGWCADCQFSNASESCAYSPIVGGQSDGLCTIPTTQLSAMLKTQLVYTTLASGWPDLEMAYNEVVAEPLVPDSTDTIVAFYTPVGTDPRARACPEYDDRPEIQGTQSVCCPIDPYTRQPTGSCTPNTAPDQRVTCDEMQALSEKVGVDVPLLWLNPTDLEQPFAEACANWSECQAEGAPCQALVGS